MSEFSIETDFYPSENGSPEERATMADVTISRGTEVLTSVDDAWAQSVRPSVRVACYPLAMWLADSWWRLLHEAGAAHHREQSHGWRMAHELRGVGGGFLWPRITFSPDGERVDITSRPSRRVLAEPLRFLSDSSGSVSTRAFSRELERFVSSVIARLHARGLKSSELEALWAEVQEERQSPANARHRALEAALGFDADDAPPELVTGLLQLEPVASAETVDELANATSSAASLRKQPWEVLKFVDGALRGGGTPARFAPPLSGSANVEASALPWQRGRSLAKHMRQALGEPSGAVSDASLETLIGAKFKTAPASAPLGLAFPSSGEHARVYFRRVHPTGRRFEVARLIGAHAMAATNSSWLVGSDAATANQKAQRAFAAEFLVPIAELVEVLGDDLSQEALERAADHFQVSPLTISSHLANNQIIEPDDVAALV